jgi:hydrogenase expression/formation protein HypE
LAHGSGGKAMHDLIEDVFVATFTTPPSTHSKIRRGCRSPSWSRRATGSSLRPTPTSSTHCSLLVVTSAGWRWVRSTTSPSEALGRFFPSCAIIAEEGLDIALLRCVARSMQDAARRGQQPGR